MKKLMSLVLAVLLVAGFTPTVFAADSIVEVSTLEELQEAIIGADDGDAIRVIQTITVESNEVIGDDTKCITLVGAEGIETLFIFSYYGRLKNLIIDGADMEDGSKVIVDTLDTVWLDNVTFQNCVGQKYAGALYIKSGSVDLAGCTFERCSGETGGAVSASVEARSVDLANCIFSNNSSNYGGATSIYCVGWVKNCLFEHNSAISGGAVTASRLTIYNCNFADNSADFGGALSLGEGQVNIISSNFLRNSARDGGAIMSHAKLQLADCVIMSNHASVVGGGLVLEDESSFSECKIYGNSADFAGADITTNSELTIQVKDYGLLYRDELAISQYDSWAWFADGDADGIGARYSADNPTSIIDLSEGTPEDGLFMAFGMWNSSPDPDPEDNPTDTPAPTPDPETDQPAETPAPTNTPQPTPSTTIIYVPIRDTAPIKNEQKEEAKTEEAHEKITLSCGEALIDQAAIADFVSSMDRFVPPQKIITRGEIAYILYGLLADSSRSALQGTGGNLYIDLDGSPYAEAIGALTNAGVFSVWDEKTFYPDENLSFGQMLTILTRFVEPKVAQMSSLANSQHWAAPSARIAYAYGWIGDMPLDLEAPTTYGALKSLLMKIYKL